ncbi:MAG: hypothetical protein UIG52_01810 [Bacteroidales bacterium]|nr:hypothetical protein [Bacteroidales bacterium]
MKKLFLFLTLSLCMLSCGKEIAYNDTIQDTFYGVKFGASREELINAFQKQGLYLNKSVSTNDFLQFVPYGRYFSFGGMDWQFVNVGLSNGKFWNIGFYLTPENKETALERYEGVLEQVSSKYNVAERPIEDENLYKKSGGRTKDGRYIVVGCYKDESFDGEMRYYVTLEYGNEKFEGVSNEL